jgi:hypothetical protein
VDTSDFRTAVLAVDKDCYALHSGADFNNAVYHVVGECFLEQRLVVRFVEYSRELGQAKDMAIET